ncbi:hypothetical protein B9Z55_005905 [Caenorhabditis nigoni]|uniref:CRE01736 n=1 Tax=Caenorhabditis nigoni TaxID=1611254 RepID=A0A2G5V2U5_9PELO|nr:hypothetical protein B9Z55_005905 [Caenorhabditis nigoni]
MEQSREFQERLRPIQIRPVPLTHNFYEQFLRKNPGYNENMETSSAASTPNTSTSTFSSANNLSASNKRLGQNSATSKLVEEIIESNKQLIEEAAMQKAASGVNVTTKQYNNLIPLSFDQEEFIRNHEASMPANRSRKL